MLTTANRLDGELHRHVLSELEYDPAVDARKIGIAVENGVVTLTGSVPSFTEKWAAEAAVKRVRGVRALANDLRVELMGTHKMSDTDIATAIANLLRWDPALPKTLQVEVENGNVLLTGEVEWNYQRVRAEKSIHRIGGVLSVANQIRLKDGSLPDDVHYKIAQALGRNVHIDDDGIHVFSADGNVVLQGSVQSLRARDEATRAAWSVPGVHTVRNELKIEPK